MTQWMRFSYFTRIYSFMSSVYLRLDMVILCARSSELIHLEPWYPYIYINVFH